MRIVDRGIIFDARDAPPAARFCTFPSLARLADGSLVAAFRTGSSKDSADEDSRVMFSTDDGATWQTAWTGFGDVPPGCGRVRCLGVTGVDRSARGAAPAGAALAGTTLAGALCWIDHSDPALPLFNPQTEGILPTRMLFALSPDRGCSWGTLAEVPLLPHTGNALTGGLLVLGDGRLALPYEAWKAYDDPAPGRHHAALRISPDGGRTWPDLAIVAHDPAGRLLYWDQRLSVDPQTGVLIAMFWTHDRQAGQDLAIHMATGSPDAAQWSRPESTGIAGQICAPLALGGGRVFAAYVHRHDPPGLRARLSDDFGRTWQAAEELVFYEKARGGRESGMGGQRDFADYWADMSIWTFGHPAPLLLPGGDVLVAYYAGDEQAMSVHWVRMAL